MKTNRKVSILALLFALMVSTVVDAQDAQQIPINTLRGPRQWSPQAKGAVIGGATGAAAGAIIHKRNRVVGGVVGGAVGAGAGYAIGKRIDNKRKAEAARRAEAARIAEARRQDNIAYGEANRTMRSAGRRAPSVNTSTVGRTAAVAAGGAAVGAVAAGAVANMPESASVAPTLVAQNQTAPMVQPTNPQPVAEQATVDERTSASWLTKLSLLIASVSLGLCGWMFLKLKKNG
ncbi:MAG: glycine zipper 2TM domain-containing protein [Cytophagales bacterium]|nr:MAG: glycine zipper 2TM domain-containing protein [Cytophagales bacterium]